MNIDAVNLLSRVVTLVTPVTDGQECVNHAASRPAKNVTTPQNPSGYTGYTFHNEKRKFQNVKNVTNVTTCNQRVVTKNERDNQQEKQCVTENVTNVTNVTSVTTQKQHFQNNSSAFTNFPDPETPGHHWLDPMRGWIQSAVETKPHGYTGQTLTNPTDPAELAELIAWERAHGFNQSAAEDQISNRHPEQDVLAPLASLPLFPDDWRFIQQRLFRIPRQQHSAVLAEYRRI